MILCDTNILIEFYKNNREVTTVLRGIGPNHLAISVITQAELYYGALDKAELLSLKRHLLNLYLLPLDPEISSVFQDLMERYSLSHRLSIPDALIAATAMANEIELYTLNVRGFRFISGLTLYQADEIAT